jgi:hypothetical protein
MGDAGRWHRPKFAPYRNSPAPETAPPIAGPARRLCSTSGSISNRKAAFPDHMESRDWEALNINKFEQARIEKASQLFRDLL